MSEVTAANGHPIGEVILSEEAIRAKEDEIATFLNKKYEGADPLHIGVLVGGGPFAIGLMSAIVRQRPQAHPRLEFIRAKTYSEGQNAGKTEITIKLPPGLDLSETPVVVSDDLCDKNLTLPAVCDYLRSEHGATDITTVVLMNKLGVRKSGPLPDIIGYDIPKRWVTGYGPDAGHKDIPDAYRYLGYVTAID